MNSLFLNLSRAQTRDQWRNRTEPAKSIATCSILSSSRAQTRDQWRTRTEPAKRIATCSTDSASLRGVNWGETRQ
jgi:hypothetical protein